jgi:hypothetical protein
MSEVREVVWPGTKREMIRKIARPNQGSPGELWG